MRIQRLVLSLVVVGLALGLALRPALAAPLKQSGPTTWTVLVGAEAEPGPTAHGVMAAWQLIRFYPQTITINVGDTILWKINAMEPETVLFPPSGVKAIDVSTADSDPSKGKYLFNPEIVLPQGGATYDGTSLTGAGAMGQPPFPNQYKLTFTKEGTYHYYSAIHMVLDKTSGEPQGMTGTVVVQPAGSAYPQTQAQIDAATPAQIAADAAQAQQADADATKVATRPGPHGGTIYTINAGYTAGVAEYMRFGPTDLTIHQGDSVEWVQRSAWSPHNIGFYSGGKEPAWTVVTSDTTGTPLIGVNPEVLLPAGGQTYSGTGDFNSGLMFGTLYQVSSPQRYSLSFARPGTYEYICVDHDSMGMSGHITVLAANNSGTPLMPKTGAVGANSDMLMVLALGLLLAGMLIRRRGIAAR